MRVNGKKRWLFMPVIWVLPLVIMILPVIGRLSVTTAAASRLQTKNETQLETNLADISEMTGMMATATAQGKDCIYSTEFHVYLCPPADPVVRPQRDVLAAVQAANLLYGGTGLLLIPDWTNDRVMAFDPTTGDLVDANFIPTDSTNLTSPKSAILSASGDSILVADQLEDVVQEYDLNGNYLSVFAPAGGANTAILDNILGMALRPNGHLLVTVTGGSNQDSVAEFDMDGNYVGNFIANGAGGIDGPFDVYQRESDWLVSSITSDDINRFDLTTGAFIAELAPINAFPQQLAQASNSNILVGNFSGTQEGVVELTPAGTVVDIYDPPGLSGYRGAYELPNGNILTTNGSGVYEIDRSGNLVDTKISGVSAQYIELVQPGPKIRLDKTAGTDPSACAPTDEISVTAGTAVTYCYQVTNTGSVTLTLHDLVDSELGPIFTTLFYPLVPGASAFITQTAPVVTTTVNTGTWTAYNPDHTDVVTATDTATVTVVSPAVTLVKTVGTDPSACAPTNSITVPAGTAVTYCYEVTNTGDVTFAVHTLVDNQLGLLLDNFAYDLVPGASAFITAAATITQSTVNTATWTAQTDSFEAAATAAASVLLEEDAGRIIYLPMIVSEPPGTAVNPAEQRRRWCGLWFCR